MERNLKSASSVKVGKRFSDKRNALNLSLKETSKILFINIDYLIAIEKGDYSIFPSETFAKAYFKKYAKYLKIEAELPDVFSLLDDGKKNTMTPKNETISRLHNGNSNLNYVIGSILTLLTLLFIIYFIEFGNTQDSQRRFLSSDQEIIRLTENININNNSLSELNSLNLTNELYLEFLGECWLEIYVNDDLIETKFFNENEIYIKKIDEPFKITIGNSEAVKGTYNGNEIDFIANANRLTKVNTINFDENKLD